MKFEDREMGIKEIKSEEGKHDNGFYVIPASKKQQSYQEWEEEPCWDVNCDVPYQHVRRAHWSISHISRKGSDYSY